VLNKALHQGIEAACARLNNGMRFAVREDQAEDLDVARRLELKLGPSQEFIGGPTAGRDSGCPWLSQRPTGLDHGLAYEAMAAGRQT
jgi:osmoprotectant transport system permease protein